MSSLDYEKTSSKQLGLILDQANQRLGAQSAFAQAADQRASFLTGAGCALSAASVGVCAQSLSQSTLMPLTVGALIAAVGFAVSAWFAMRSGRCVDFHPAGYYPKNFLNDLRAKKSYHRIRAEIAEEYNERLDFNGRQLVWRGRQTDRAAFLMFASPLVGALGSIVYTTALHWAQVGPLFKLAIRALATAVRL